MQINIKDITNGSMDGKDVYICDYRQEDINKRPIRKVPPTKVKIVSNNETYKRIYYSESHFRPYGKNGDVQTKVIPVYDNTGFRSYTGVSVMAFDNEQECIDHWNNAIEEVIEKIEERKKVVLVELDEKQQHLELLKK